MVKGNRNSMLMKTFFFTLFVFIIQVPISRKNKDTLEY